MFKIHTPLTNSIHISKFNSTQIDEEKEYMSYAPCDNLMQSLMYVIAYNRSYLAQVVSLVSRYLSEPSNVCRSLKETRKEMSY